jgi:hypothetical protein
MTNPNPGSEEAIKAGCACPVIDNNHGKGIPIPQSDGTLQAAFWIDETCPVHSPKEAPKEV